MIQVQTELSVADNTEAKRVEYIKGLGGSMHLFDKNAGIEMSVPIVASHIPIGTGIGFYSKSHHCKKKFII